MQIIIRCMYVLRIPVNDIFEQQPIIMVHMNLYVPSMLSRTEQDFCLRHLFTVTALVQTVLYEIIAIFSTFGG